MNRLKAVVHGCEQGRNAAVVRLSGLLNSWLDTSGPAPLGFDKPPDFHHLSLIVAQKAETACKAIEQDLRRLATARSCGRLSETDFVEAVLGIEEDVAKNGFTLTASNTLDDWTVFKLRRNGSPNSCGSFEFLPATGEFRPVGSGGE